jgi:hypothetical protein
MQHFKTHHGKVGQPVQLLVQVFTEQDLNPVPHPVVMLCQGNGFGVQHPYIAKLVLLHMLF